MDTILSPLEPAAELLRESRRPLVVLAHPPTLDTLAAARGLLEVIADRCPGAAIVCPGFVPGPEHSSIPGITEILTKFPNLRDFIISIDTSRVQLDALRYDNAPALTRIYLTPKNNFFEARDVTTSAAPFNFDHLVTIGLRRLEDLGPAYQHQRDFFYHTPILNLDCRANNTRFGHVNLVDVTAVSQSELVAELVHKLAPTNLTESAATTLLTGIISATHGFQSHHVTPRTLSVAARLMAAGAKRDQIIRQLYHTKTVPILKLWGRALTNLQSANNDRLVWTSVSKTDLDAQHATAEQVAGVTDELLATTPSAVFAATLIETPPTVTVIVIRRTDAPAVEWPSELAPRGDNQYHGQIEGPLPSVEKQIIGTLRTALG